jgi:hypothetical protein
LFAIVLMSPPGAVRVALEECSHASHSFPGAPRESRWSEPCEEPSGFYSSGAGRQETWLPAPPAWVKHFPSQAAVLGSIANAV